MQYIHISFCIYAISTTIIWNIIHVNKQMKIPELGVGCNCLWATHKFPHQAWRKPIVYSPPSSNIQKYPLLFPNPLICFKFHRFELFFSVCNPPYLVCWLSCWASLQVMLRIQVVWSKLYYRSEIRQYHKMSWVIHAIYNHYSSLCSPTTSWFILHKIPRLEDLLFVPLTIISPMFFESKKHTSRLKTSMNQLRHSAKNARRSMSHPTNHP